MENITQLDELMNKQLLFIQMANQVHNNKYDYSLVGYKNTHTKVKIICPDHGVFEQSPVAHKRGQGCPKCKHDNIRTTIQDFVSTANRVHNNKYDYSLVEYKNTMTKVDIICPIHGIFKQKPNDHLKGHGCKKCAPVSYSLKSLIWLDNIMKQENIHIQHAGNGGEYRIPNTCLSADGYCVETNTIYEFDGDAYHGNPNRYQHNEHCHPYDKDMTAEELYQSTLNKHARLKDLGYNVISIWESEFDQLSLLPINNYNDIVISKIDSTYPDRLYNIGLEIVGDYIGSKHKHNIKCLKCGEIHIATPVAKIWSYNRHPNIYGCPKCNKQVTINSNRNRGNYVNRLLALNYKAYDYKNAGTKCVLECTICGKRKNVIPSAIIQRNVPCCNTIS